MQKVAKINQKSKTTEWKSTVMNNMGMVGVYPADSGSDMRFILAKTETSSGKKRGDLFSYDPTLAKNRWDYIFSFGKFMQFDWLFADKKAGWISYRIDAVKVQWYLTYDTQSSSSAVTGIYENIYTGPYTNYNHTTNALNQLNGDGTIKQTVNSVSATTGFTRAEPFRPVLNTIKNAKYVSETNNGYWVASNPEVQRVWVFNENNLISEIIPTKPVRNYGMRAFASEDSMGAAIIAVAYEKSGSSKVFIDLWKPAFYPGNSALLHLWQEEALNMTRKELDTFTMQRGGQLMFINDYGGTQAIPFCSAGEFFKDGFCQACAKGNGTLYFQQDTCMPCYDMPYYDITGFTKGFSEPVTAGLNYQTYVAYSLCSNPLLSCNLTSCECEYGLNATECQPGYGVVPIVPEVNIT